jgi:response regulator RpfG family c-di-GMP phosphodiesterase
LRSLRRRVTLGLNLDARDRRAARRQVGDPMIALATAASRLPLVLVVDPVAASRHTMWRVLSRSFGVLEAPDARRARDWLASRADIDAVVVQRELPDADGYEFVQSLAAVRAAVASRVLVVTRPVDLRRVLTSLTRWLFSHDVRKAEVLLREADRIAS